MRRKAWAYNCLKKYFCVKQTTMGCWGMFCNDDFNRKYNRILFHHPDNRPLQVKYLIWRIVLWTDGLAELLIGRFGVIGKCKWSVAGRSYPPSKSWPTVWLDFSGNFFEKKRYGIGFFHEDGRANHNHVLACLVSCDVCHIMFFTILQTSYCKPNVHRHFNDGDSSWFKKNCRSVFLRIFSFPVFFWLFQLLIKTGTILKRPYLFCATARDLAISLFIIDRHLRSDGDPCTDSRYILGSTFLDKFLKIDRFDIQKTTHSSPWDSWPKEGWVLITFSQSEHVKFFLFHSPYSVKVLGMLIFHRPFRPPPRNWSKAGTSPILCPKMRGACRQKKEKTSLAQFILVRKQPSTPNKPLAAMKTCFSRKNTIIYDFKPKKTTLILVEK